MKILADGREKSILITGCSTGIGRAAAIAFARKNYRVVASVRKLEDMNRIEEPGVHMILMDMANPAEVNVGVNEALRLCNEKIDAVIHNAGAGFYGALEDHSRESMEAQFSANTFGVHQINRILIPKMRSFGEGRIVIVTSVLGFVALPYRGLYCMSKFALEAYADTLRLELAKSGIKVSLVEPGPIETSFRKNAYVEFQKRIKANESVHIERYKPFVNGLKAEKSLKKFALRSENCVPALIHATESSRPKIRYRITFPTKLFAFLKRILPSKWMDEVLAKG